MAMLKLYLTAFFTSAVIMLPNRRLFLSMRSLGGAQTYRRLELVRLSCSERLRITHRVAQMRHADTLNYRRAPKCGSCTCEVIKEADAGTQKDRGYVNANFVQEPSFDALLDGIGTMHSDRFSTRGGFRFLHSAFDTVRHEMDR